MDRFDTDVMDDLMDAADAPAGSAMDDFDGADGFDDFDGGDEGDAFLGRIIGGLGNLLGGAGANAFDEDGFDEDGFDDGFDEDGFDAAADDYDSFDDAVADALDAEDGDEFFRRIARLARGAARGIGRVAGTVGRGIGQAARVVGPIASMIPLPQAQMIGRLANVAGRLLADGADEFEAIDALVEEFDEEALDAAAPVVAGLALRRAVPNVARMPRPARRRLVRAVSQATRTAVRRQGAPAARAVTRVVRTAARAAQARRIAPRTLPQVVRRVTQQVLQRPAAARPLSRPLTPPARRVVPRPRVAAGAARRGHVCRHCGTHQLHFRGPVRISIQGRR
ncbi:MAG: hypothetical protein ACT4P0_03935 [Panacagrimonas sp.]